MTFPTVALVLSLADPALSEALSATMPTWIGLREPDSRPQVSGDLTSFALGPGETAENAARRIAYALDEHHSEASQRPGYRYLIVFGCRLESALQLTLQDLGFVRFALTEFGFVATKR